MGSLIQGATIVCRDGYQWVTGASYRDSDANEDRRYLVTAHEAADGAIAAADRIVLSKEADFRRYDPFKEEEALFRIFADLQPTEDSILDFANSYGPLWHRKGFWLPPTLRNWIVYHDYIRRGIAIWDAVRNKDEEVAREHVTSFRRVVDPMLPELREIAERYGNMHGGHSLKDFLANILPKLRRETNETWVRAAEGLLTAELAYLSPVTETYIYLHRTQGVSLGFVPTDLCSSLWFQLALAVTENHDFRRCKLCDKPFRISPDVNRADRIFCSDNCRVKAYKRRKVKARKMRAGGAHLRTIVKAVESDLKTVKRWLGEDK